MILPVLKKMKKSITIIVPAYNEEKYLSSAIKKYNKVAKNRFKDYEIIIFDDCSIDKTGEIADALARRNPRIRVIHNKKNKGMGYNFRKGVELATKEYCTMFMGEGETWERSLMRLLDNIGKADIIISYIGNRKIRSLYRRVISDGFVTLLNLLFDLRLKYYNGYNMYKTRDLKRVKLTTNSFACQAEAIVRLLKSKKRYSYFQIPYYTRKTTGSSLFRIKNLIGVIRTVTQLFIDIYFKKEFFKRRKTSNKS